MEGAENEASRDDADSGLVGLLTSARYQVVGLILVVVAAAVCLWLGSWIVVDVRPSFEDTVGRVLLDMSGGLFIGAGILAALVALRVVHAVERRIVEPYYRDSSTRSG